MSGATRVLGIDPATGLCGWAIVAREGSQITHVDNGVVVLTEGDGAGVTTEASLSLTAHESAEILLIDSASTPGSIGSGATA